jgi:hypothetical protein
MSEPVPDPVSLTYVESEKLADVEAAGSDFKESKDGSVEIVSEIDDEAQLAETEALEARLASGEATDAEYKVRTSHDVAVKVLSTRYIPSPYLPQRRLIFSQGRHRSPHLDVQDVLPGSRILGLWVRVVL